MKTAVQLATATMIGAPAGGLRPGGRSECGRGMGRTKGWADGSVGSLFLALTALFLLGGPLAAQTERIQERRPLRPDADVEIGAIAHSITVERWDRNEIEILGEFDSEWEVVNIRGDDRYFRFELRSVERNRRQDSRRMGARELRVRVPEGVALNLNTVSGELEVSGLTGSVTANTVSGNVRMDGNVSSARLSTVSGNVTFRGAAEDIQANTVSGNVDVTSGSSVSAGSLQAVSGTVRFDGSLTRGGRLQAESHSGNVELTLASDVDARFSLSTFSGRVTSDMRGATNEVHDRGRYVPAESLTFTTGTGGGRVEAKSFSGNVRIRSGNE